jgi:sulfatase modifying factor 1
VNTTAGLGLALVLAAGCIVLACSSFSESVPDDAGAVEAGGADSTLRDASPAIDGGATCPSGRGPSMLRLDRPAGAGSYCIDATEVTQAQYKAFLDANDKPAKVGCEPTFDPACTFGPPSDFVPATRGDYPISCVDWCDAVAFCAWAGKRLCGDLAGADSAADVHDRSEWSGACSGFGQRAYPWGSEAERNAGKCNLGADAAVPAGSIGTCQGASPGLFDMIGNVREWQANCSGDSCDVRGGGFGDQPNPTDKMDIEHCRAPVTGMPKTDRFVGLGFRCCADLR